MKKKNITAPLVANQIKTIELINGSDVIQVKLRQSARAKKLRIHVGLRGVRLVTPVSVNIKHAHNFLMTEEEWIRENLKKFQSTVPVGNEIMVFGIPHTIEATYTASKKVQIENNKILVSKIDNNSLGKIKKHLSMLLKEKIYIYADEICKKLGAQYANISLRDQSGRWGSCSSRGRISFSWRLAFAPLFVIESVVAHELCHLLEMSHNQRFWSLLAEVNPRCKEADLWLKENGNLLHHYIPKKHS
ncbi:Putative metal-dependent hydrolase [endosymbiont of Acanthamoeba sp. UWC8]|uniref:M48 family metallopeptidase n=1 Tax=endosymbiont of Acanthamoeba sp. UWC8 TaxID=86106 RepID=UPI0004D1EA73|nr:SprT family zinc-dependent metalloprotease [endosymbiont of Acanthamoeba sp. UWC8]AIF80676.1 Putative metal-dependent hydrolase [endosymbiont of Acanthamoeba sp. UWC8]